jgi:hypothetical protein
MKVYRETPHSCTKTFINTPGPLVMEEEREGLGMWHVWETGFWWGDLWERIHLQYLGVDERIIVGWGGADIAGLA